MYFSTFCHKTILTEFKIGRLAFPILLHTDSMSYNQTIQELTDVLQRVSLDNVCFIHKNKELCEGMWCFIT